LNSSELTQLKQYLQLEDMRNDWGSPAARATSTRHATSRVYVPMLNDGQCFNSALSFLPRHATNVTSSSTWQQVLISLKFSYQLSID